MQKTMKAAMGTLMLVAAMGTNGCGLMPGATPQQTAGSPLGGTATAVGAAAAAGPVAGTVRPTLTPTAPTPTSPQIIPGVTVPNAAGQQFVGNGLVWDRNIMGYRDQGTGEPMTLAQSSARAGE